MQTPNIPALLLAFAEQRPGLEFANYGDVPAYRAESRSITHDLHDARTLLAACDHVAPEEWAQGFRAFSGRLTLEEGWTDQAGVHCWRVIKPDNPSTPFPIIRHRLDYCVGQYWPTEYRRAVCAVAAGALWARHRDDYAADARPGESAGSAIRRSFKRRFGAHIARRWFG